MKSILVVCEGNICRSPMAEALLAAALPRTRVTSAGLNALVGKPADTAAVELMRRRGLRIDDHRATQITRPLCLNADIVLVMEREQRQRLERLYPEVCGRVFRIAEHSKLDVPDPYQKPLAEFRNALSIIEEGVDSWLHRIQRL